MSSREVLVVYPFMPHYRRAVFEELDRSDRYDYVFASGLEGRDGIPALPAAAVRRHIRLTNRRIGPALWQSGLLSQAIRRRPAAVLVLGDYSHLSTWALAVVLRVRRVPVYFWTIGWHRPEGGLRRLARLAFYRLATALLLYGDGARKIGASLGYPSARMSVIGNSVEIPVLPPRHRPTEVPIIGAVIRINPVKRLDLLIQAAARLAHSDRPVRVRIVGPGDGSHLARLAEALGVELELPGPAYGGEALAAVYAELAVSVVPAAVGLTAIQSLAHGVPVITDDDEYAQMPEHEAVIEGVTGGRFRAGDVDDLARAVALALDVGEDERTRRAERCRAEVERAWNPRVQRERIEEAIGR